MESKKVKEILKFCSEGKDCYDGCPYKHDTHCVMKISKQSLTLINELESENKTIKFNMKETEKASFNINQMNGNLVLENQQLKDRIAELEKKNAKLDIELDKRDCIDYPCRLIEKEQLKQFSERLKEKCNDKNAFICSNSITATDIDEILKEFTNG